MENENEDIQLEDEIQDPPEVAEGEEDKTNWKALALKYQGTAKRYKTKLEKLKEPPVKVEDLKKTEPDKPTKTSDFDYGQKAFLKTYGISGADELALVKSFRDRTGDEIDTLVTDDIFTAKLKALRDAKAVKDAIPESTKRSTGGGGNKVDYWLAKYQSGTPLAEVPLEIRQEVLNARLKTEEQKRKFG